MTAAQLDELKVRAIEKFDHVAKLFDKMRVAFEKEGYKSPGYLKSQTKILDELMSLRFTAKMVEKLSDTLRRQVDEVRSLESRSTRSSSTSAACRAPFPQGVPRQ